MRHGTARENGYSRGISRVLKQTGGRSRMLKGEPRLNRAARGIRPLIAVALLLGLFLPFMEVAAQDENADGSTTEALSEVPSTGARRPGPVILAASRVATTEPAPTPAPKPEGVAPAELQIDSVG